MKFGEVGGGCVNKNSENEDSKLGLQPPGFRPPGTGPRKNIKQSKSLRWWEVQQSPREGSMCASTTPSGVVRHCEKPLSKFSSCKPLAYGLRFAFGKWKASRVLPRDHSEYRWKPPSRFSSGKPLSKRFSSGKPLAYGLRFAFGKSFARSFAW